MPRGVAFPTTEEEVASVLQQAAAAGEVVIPWGAGTKQDYGSPLSRADLVVSLERLNQVVEYVPADMTITVQAGMRLADLQAVTAIHGQTVPLDPPRAVQATLGGVVATASSGPRRTAYGGVRDLVLGVRLALADGRIIRAGGKVVKNVAGYDLTRLAIGSLGTLGIVTEVSLRLRPLPADTKTVLYGFRDAERALGAADSVLGSELLPAAITLLSPEAARRLGTPGSYCLALALEESPENNAYQVQRLSQVVQGQDGASTIAGPDETVFWDSLANFDQRFGAIWRARVNSLIGDLPRLLRGNAVAHVASGTVLLYGFGEEESFPEQAVLESGPLALRESVAVWGEARPEWKLAERIKQTFDPGRVLNRGRYVGGI
ncbi:MAG TPA: FAD-binding oxidoreductase [Bryobacteraceae bacterium]|nr:FAD-binding oxidoreductase [Bryobacteraceae bacterium]